MKPLFNPPYPFVEYLDIYSGPTKIGEQTHVHLVMDVEEYFENTTKKERNQLLKYFND